MNEPFFRPRDLECWSMWMRTAEAHARTLGYLKRVDSAVRAADSALAASNKPVAMWSAGKDSTALVHLLAGLGAKVPAVSQKDDLDYPGEVEYLLEAAERFGIDLTIVRPGESLFEFLRAGAGQRSMLDEIHSRNAELSERFFYDIVEVATLQNDLIFLGLRKHESRPRLMNRCLRGLTYTKTTGQTICNPLGDWTGLDVMAYMRTNDIEPLLLYKCVAFMHSEEPWRIRKSWWIPAGSSVRHGLAAWLNYYWPSLSAKLGQLFCDGDQFK